VDTAQMPAPEMADQADAAAEPAVEAAAPAEAEKPAPKAKLPLHQRIFGRSETAANMPEPPKAEEAPVEKAEADVSPTEEQPLPAGEPAAEPAAEETEEEIPEDTVEETAQEAADDAEETRNE